MASGCGFSCIDEGPLMLEVALDWVLSGLAVALLNNALLSLPIASASGSRVAELHHIQRYTAAPPPSILRERPCSVP